MGFLLSCSLWPIYELLHLTAIEENKTREKAWGGVVVLLCLASQISSQEGLMSSSQGTAALRAREKGQISSSTYTHTFPALLLPECQGSCLGNYSPCTRNTACALDIQLLPQTKRSQLPPRELGRRVSSGEKGSSESWQMTFFSRLVITALISYQSTRNVTRSHSMP